MYSALTFFCSLLSYVVVAQSKVRGRVLDIVGSPLGNASVLLLNSRDSSLVKGMMTTKEGSYSFEKVSLGSYLVASSFVGYKQVYSPVFQANSNDNIDLPALRLSEKETKLSNATVTAKKPLIEQTIDRLVINVANNITSAGSTVLDVLERSPGVIVDRQNNSLSINGKDGVVVMMNGKINHMPLSGLVQMLAGMPSDNIEKIELITTPPAYLDAEGNAGYINIVLKRNAQYGTNGSYSLTGGYEKGEIIETSVNFNHRKNKINLYGDYSYSHTRFNQFFGFYHAVTNQGKLLENYSASQRHGLLDFHNGKIGLDYEISNKTIIGALLTIYYRRWDMDATNNSQVYSNQQLDTTVNLLVHEYHPTFSYDVNINLQHSYKEGEKLTVNLDHMYYNDDNPTSYLNSYYNPDGGFLFDEQIKSAKTTPINLWVGAFDYTKNLSKKLSYEGGAKTTISHFTNIVQIDKLQGGTWNTDNSLSATYDLNENISAAYSSLNWKASDKTNMKLGLRYEYTNSNLGTAKEQNIVDRHYGNLFPSFFFSHNINEQNTANLSYSRRVTRPTFWNLAPFVIFMDPNTYFSGNPGLQPSITDNVNLAYTYRKKILSVAYSYEANPITNFSPKVDPKTNKETLAAENQDNLKTITVSLSFPIEIAKWWSVQGNVNGSYQQLEGQYQGQPIRLKSEYFILNLSQNFRLPKDYTVSLSGFYRSGGLFGIYKISPIGSLDFGIQKKMADKKSSLRFNYSNILNTMIFKPEVNMPDKNLVTKGELIFTRPNVRLTFTHNFGGDQVKGKRNRSLGTEDEKSRLQQF